MPGPAAQRGAGIGRSGERGIGQPPGIGDVKRRHLPQRCGVECAYRDVGLIRRGPQRVRPDGVEVVAVLGRFVLGEAEDEDALQADERRVTCCSPGHEWIVYDRLEV